MEKREALESVVDMHLTIKALQEKLASIQSRDKIRQEIIKEQEKKLRESESEREEAWEYATKLKEKLLDAKKERDFHEANDWKKIKELEEKLREAHEEVAGLQQGLDRIVDDRVVELEKKLAEAERKIKSFDAYVMRDEKLSIAVEALERYADPNEYDRRECEKLYIAEEALAKIKAQ